MITKAVTITFIKPQPLWERYLAGRGFDIERKYPMITDFQYQSMLARLAPKHGPANVEAAVESESDLHQDILDYCKSKGWIALHGSMAHKAKRTAGEPDFTILADGGRVFFVEAKSKTGKLTPEQLGLRLWAEKLGHKIHEVRNLAAFIEIVNLAD